MSETELWRTLKITDPEASTIRGKLVQMGYPVTGLDKLEHFLIGIDGEVTRDDINSVGGLLVNPNKHLSLFPRYSSDESRGRFERSYNARVLVETDIDPEAVDAFGTLRDRFGYGNRVQYVRREIVWGINLNHSAGEESVRDYVHQLVQEPTYFFANPNFQKSRVEF